MKKLTFALMLLLVAVWSVPVMAVSVTDYGYQPHWGLMNRGALYSKVPGFQIAFGGITTMETANNDTIYVAQFDWDADDTYDDFDADQFMGYGIDEYIGGGDFFLRVCMTADSAAPFGEERPIVAFDSDAGMIIVSPTFTAAVGQDEYVMVIHRSLLGKTKGQLRYHGTIDLLDGEATGITDGDDSLYVPDLAGFGDNYWELGDYWLHFTKTTDGAAPQGQWRPILDSDGATGCMTFTTAFSVEATTLDEVEVVHYSLVPPHFRYVGVEWSDWTEVVIDFSSATWNTAATQEAIAVTGDVELEIAMACSTNFVATSADSLWFFLGEAGATGYRMVSLLAEDADAGENLIPTGWSPGYIWSAAALTTKYGSTVVMTAHMGADWGFQIDDHALTGGILTIWFRYRPLSTGGSAAAGAGGTL